MEKNRTVPFFELDRRTRKFSLLDEKLSQFAAVFAVLIVMRFFPGIVDVDLIWSIPLCTACAVWAFYVYFFEGEKKDNTAEVGSVRGKIGWNRRIKKFTFLDLAIAHLAFAFALFIAVKIVPLLKEVTLEWSIPLFIGFAVKPFYVFWIKNECSSDKSMDL